GLFVPALGTDRTLASLPLFGHTLAISAGQLNAVAVIVFLSIVNYFGVKEGSLFQRIVTVLKIASFAGFMIPAVVVGRGSWSHFVPLLGRADAVPRPARAGAGGFRLRSSFLSMQA